MSKNALNSSSRFSSLGLASMNACCRMSAWHGRCRGQCIVDFVAELMNLVEKRRMVKVSPKLFNAMASAAVGDFEGVVPR